VTVRILSLGLGKFKSMCCIFEPRTKRLVFQNTPTTQPAIHTLLKSRQIDLVVMEACGPSGWISDVCHELGLKTLVCSTIEEAWHWKNVKRKTDRDDALKLARTGNSDREYIRRAAKRNQDDGEQP
jgi:transposase